MAKKLQLGYFSSFWLAIDNDAKHCQETNHYPITLSIR